MPDAPRRSLPLLVILVAQVVACASSPALASAPSVVEALAAAGAGAESAAAPSALGEHEQCPSLLLGDHEPARALEATLLRALEAMLLRALADFQTRLRVEMDERAALLRVEMGERDALLRVEMGARFELMQRSLSLLGANVTLLSADVALLSANVLELHDVTPTVSAVHRIRSCSEAHAWYVTAPVICSAFPYASPHSSQPYFVSAAHCFKDSAKGVDLTGATLTLVQNGASSLSCTVLRLWESPSDLAVLQCAAGARALSGLVGAAKTPPLGSAVAAVGYVLDALSGPSEFFLDAQPDTALNFRFARITNVAGRRNSNASLPGSCELAQPGDETPSGTPWLIRPTGVFDMAVARGMSGGPLLDLRCGVVGVIHGRACESSLFLGLGPVDDFIAARERAL